MGIVVGQIASSILLGYSDIKEGNISTFFDNAAACETSMERYREIKSETKKNNIA